MIYAALRMARPDPACEGCRYMDTMIGPTFGACLFILAAGHRRPCEAGEGCTVKQISDVDPREGAEALLRRLEEACRK